MRQLFSSILEMMKNLKYQHSNGVLALMNLLGSEAAEPIVLF